MLNRYRWIRLRSQFLLLNHPRIRTNSTHTQFSTIINNLFRIFQMMSNLNIRYQSDRSLNRRPRATQLTSVRHVIAFACQPVDLNGMQSSVELLLQILKTFSLLSSDPIKRNQFLGPIFKGTPILSTFLLRVNLIVVWHSYIVIYIFLTIVSLVEINQPVTDLAPANFSVTDLVPAASILTTLNNNNESPRYELLFNSLILLLTLVSFN